MQGSARLKGRDGGTKRSFRISMPSNIEGSVGSAMDTPSTTTVQIVFASLASHPSANETAMFRTQK